MSLECVRVKEEPDWECGSVEDGARECGSVNVQDCLYVEIEVKSEPVDCDQLQQNDSDFSLRAAGESSASSLSRGAVCTNSFAEEFQSTYKHPHKTNCATFKQSSHEKESAVDKTHKREPNVNSEENAFVCNTCGRQFAKKNALLSHTEIHTKKEPFPLEICKQQFMYLSNLNDHKAHTDVPCEIANKSKRRKRKNNVKQYYSCDVCPKQFSRVASFLKHKIIHTGEKPFSCEFCDKQFYHSSNLITHKRTHTGEKPYTCEVCNKQFSISTHLKLHKRIHTGEKPYACVVCTKRFCDWSALERHKRTHTGEKPFACEVCTKQFACGANLKRHKQTHTVEKL